jgi:hypothetical protein
MMFATLWRELNDAEARRLQIVQIRVSPAAIPGAPTTTMITPERIRAMRTYVIQLPGRDTPDAFPDPDAQERWREIVIHPVDWQALLMEHALHGHYQPGTAGVEPDRVFGIPVSR